MTSEQLTEKLQEAERFASHGELAMAAMTMLTALMCHEIDKQKERENDL